MDAARAMDGPPDSGAAFAPSRTAADMGDVKKKRIVGLLALQGAFEEHEAAFQRLPQDLLDRVKFVEVRLSQELDQCDALVIPGGETTTMKIIAGSDPFMDHLRNFVHGGPGSDGVQRLARPVWGTCAGCILLSDSVINAMPDAGGSPEVPAKRCKYGEQVGGLPISTCRNFFGRQAGSFEATTTVDDTDGLDSHARHAFSDFPAVFIRAPGIISVGSDARALARVRHPRAAVLSAKDGKAIEDVIVAVESKKILVTCFHPELSLDSRIHRYFVERFVFGTEAC